MATTVRLLQNYTLSGVPYKAGDLVSIDSTLATQLSAAKVTDSAAAAITQATTEGKVIKYPDVDALTYQKNASKKNNIDNFLNLADIPAGFSGTAQVGTQLYVGDGVSLVLVNGLYLSASNTAAQNTALIQGELDRAYAAGGGVVEISSPGVFNIANPGGSEILTIGSNVTIDIGAAILRGPTSSVAAIPLIASKNWRSNRVVLSSDIASAMSNGGVAPEYLVCTVTEVGHTRTVGSYCQLKGDTTNIYNGVWPVDTVSANSWTFRQYGFTAAPGNSAGTIYAYKADGNFKVLASSGGYFDANLNGNSATNGVHCSIFNKVGQVTLDPSAFRNAAKYAMYIINFDDVTILPGKVLNSSDGVHFHGPGKTVAVGRLWAQTADDAIAFTTNNVGYTAYDLLDADGTINSNGDINGIDIDILTVSIGKSRNILLSGGDTQTISNVTVAGVRRLSALSGTGGCVLFDNLSGAGTANFNNININNLSGNFSNIVPVSVGSTAGGGCAIKSLKVDGISCKVLGSYNGLKRHIIDSILPNNSIDGLILRNVDVDIDQAGLSQSSAMIYSVPTTGSAALKGVVVSGVNLVGNGATSFSYGAISVANNCAGDSIIISDSIINTNQAYLYSDSASTNTDTIDIKISNCGVGTSGQAIVQGSTTHTLRTHLSNIDGEECSQAVFYMHGGTGNHRLAMSSVKTNAKLIKMSGGTNALYVSEGGCNARDGVSGSVSVTAGTLYPQGGCLDLGVDVSLAAVQKVQGAQVYSTAAGTGKQGQAVCNGTNWYALATGASGVNTLIV